MGSFQSHFGSFQNHQKDLLRTYRFVLEPVNSTKDLTDLSLFCLHFFPNLVYLQLEAQLYTKGLNLVTATRSWDLGFNFRVLG